MPRSRSLSFAARSLVLLIKTYGIRKGRKDISLVVVLVVNIVVYRWNELARGLFFAFGGVWFLGHGLSNIVKTF